MSDTDMGSSDPNEQPKQSTPRRSAPRALTKKSAAAKPSLGARWQVGGSSPVAEQLVRSAPLVAIVGIAALAKWAPSDVQALVAIVAPIIYLPGRSPKGGV